MLDRAESCVQIGRLREEDRVVLEESYKRRNARVVQVKKRETELQEGKRRESLAGCIKERNNTTCKRYRNRGKIRRGNETDEYKEMNTDN